MEIMSVTRTETIGTSSADIGEPIVLSGLASIINFEVSPDGGDLSAFVVQTQEHPQGEFHDFLSGADFDSTTNANMLWATTTGPQEIGDGNVAAAHVRINAAYAVKFKATASAANTTVTIRATARMGD